MVRALLICSDGDCAETFEAYGELAELESLACECGCALAVWWVEDELCQDGWPGWRFALDRAA